MFNFTKLKMLSINCPKAYFISSVHFIFLYYNNIMKLKQS